MAKKTVGFGSDFDADKNKAEFNSLVINVNANPDIITFGLRQIFTVHFIASQREEIFDLLEKNHKNSLCVGLVSDSRLNFLPNTIGIYVKVIGLNRDKFTCSFKGVSRFEILDFLKSNFAKKTHTYARIRVLEDREIDFEEESEVDFWRSMLDQNVLHLRGVDNPEVYNMIKNWHWTNHIFTQKPGILAEEIAKSVSGFSESDIQNVFYVLDPAVRFKVAVNRFVAFAEKTIHFMYEFVPMQEQIIQLSDSLEQMDKDAKKLKEENEMLRGIVQGKKDKQKGAALNFSEMLRGMKKFMLPEMASVIEDRIREYYGSGERDAKVETYLRTVLSLPWGKRAENSHNSLGLVRKQLDHDHYGLNYPKEKILEFLAVQFLNPENKSSTMCLLGPPGVGKTSLGQSLGKEGALNRPWVRISMGGVHDEPTIRGHNYTYVGSGIGRIMQAIKQSGVMNPIILIDEIDKLSEQGANGNPAAALLEVLDPLQNNRFIDHYLSGPVDLSDVFFILTGNNFMAINPILRDRLHVINIESYDMYEKFQIAKKFLVPKQLKNCGLAKFLSFSDEALDILIQEYTHEAGVRALERKIENICKHKARVVVETERLEFMKINAVDTRNILGPPEHTHALSRPTPAGCCNGLVVTGYVGGISVVETKFTSRNNGRILFTGVKEKIKASVEKALSLMEDVSPALKKEVARRLKENGIHFNMGNGNIDTEGPSAGIAILCALFSLFSKIPIREKLAMTGAIGLTMGDVGTVGGIKEKVMGAMSAGINELILPENNRSHFDKIDKRITNKFEKVHFVKSVDEVLKIVFGEGYKNTKFE